MKFNVFKSEVKKNLEERGYVVKEYKMNKTNRTLTAFTVDTDNSNSDIKPTFYYEELYNTDMSIESVINTVIQYNMEYNGSDLGVSVDNIINFNAIKDRIYCAVINRDKNEELLKNIPHFVKLDLAIIFKARVACGEFLSTFIINNNLMEKWKVDVNDLLYYAGENKDDLIGEDILIGLHEKMEKIIGKKIPKPSDECYSNIYFFSNRFGNDGASMIFTHMEYMREFAEKKGSDILILPSSRHEVLLMPVIQVEDYNYIKETVMWVNQTNVSDEDFLSDNVYLYCREDDDLHIV